MSAPSLMCRTSLLILIMTAGMAAYAADAPSSVAHKHAARRRPVAATRTHAAHHAPARVARHGETARAHSRVVRAHVQVPLHRYSEREVRHPEETGHRREFAVREIRADEIRRGEEAAAADSSATKPPVTERVEIERRRTVDDASSREEARSATPEAETTDSGTDPKTDSSATPRPAATEAAEDSSTPPNAELAESASLHIARGGMPPPMRGSLTVLERQDARLQADGLERIEDENDLAARIAHHMLVPLPASAALTVNPELPTNHRYCRPWAAQFVADLARAHEAAFHRPLEVNSAVRTVAYQERLMRINGNAAPAEGDIWSPHLMGASIDFGKKGMSLDEIAWMRRRLTALEAAGKIDVEEEFQQACFHITVYKSYAPEHTVRPSRAHGGDTPSPSESEEAGSTGAPGQ
jgi:Family of unknown function (DUF5715)